MRRALAGLALAAALPLGTIALAEIGEESGENRRLAAWDEFEELLRDQYAYIDSADFDVDAQFARSRDLAARAPDMNAVRRIMHRTALAFGDPHLLVGPLEPDDFVVVMTAADLDARFEGARAIIADVRRSSPAFDAGLRPGDTIEAIDGLPAAEAALLPYGAVLADPTRAQRDYGLVLAVNGRREGVRRLTVSRPGEQVRDIILPSTRDWAISLGDRPLLTLDFIAQGAGRQIAHVTILNSLGNNDTITAFDEAMTRAGGADALILDLRETPSGGNTEVARSIIGHFIDTPRPYQMHRIPALEREFTVPRQFVEYVFPRAPRFDGPVVVLQGRWTGSMGEGIVIGMDAASDAVTVGSNMGDLLGALWNRDLSISGARVDLGGEALFHVDGTPREDYVADVPVSPASTARDGSDPALARALVLVGADGDGN